MKNSKSKKKETKKIVEVSSKKESNNASTDSVSGKKISGKFNLSLPKNGGKNQLTDRQIDLIYFMTTVVALLGIIFGKEVILRLFELLISSVF